MLVMVEVVAVGAVEVVAVGAVEMVAVWVVMVLDGSFVVGSWDFSSQVVGLAVLVCKNKHLSHYT